MGEHREVASSQSEVEPITKSADTLTLDFSLWNDEKYISAVYAHPGCGVLLLQLNGLRWGEGQVMQRGRRNHRVLTGRLRGVGVSSKRP